jgi:hypothetical protein
MNRESCVATDARHDAQLFILTAQIQSKGRYTGKRRWRACDRSAIHQTLRTAGLIVPEFELCAPGVEPAEYRTKRSGENLPHFFRYFGLFDLDMEVTAVATAQEALLRDDAPLGAYTLQTGTPEIRRTLYGLEPVLPSKLRKGDKSAVKQAWTAFLLANRGETCAFFRRASPAFDRTCMATAKLWLLVLRLNRAKSLREHAVSSASVLERVAPLVLFSGCRGFHVMMQGVPELLKRVSSNQRFADTFLDETLPRLFAPVCENDGDLQEVLQALDESLYQAGHGVKTDLAAHPSSGLLPVLLSDPARDATCDSLADLLAVIDKSVPAPLLKPCKVDTGDASGAPTAVTAAITAYWSNVAEELSSALANAAVFSMIGTAKVARGKKRLADEAFGKNTIGFYTSDVPDLGETHKAHLARAVTPPLISNRKADIRVPTISPQPGEDTPASVGQNPHSSNARSSLSSSLGTFARCLWRASGRPTPIADRSPQRVECVVGMNGGKYSFGSAQALYDFYLHSARLSADRDLYPLQIVEASDGPAEALPLPPLQRLAARCRRATVCSVMRAEQANFQLDLDLKQPACMGFLSLLEGGPKSCVMRDLLVAVQKKYGPDVYALVASACAFVDGEGHGPPRARQAAVLAKSSYTVTFVHTLDEPGQHAKLAKVLAAEMAQRHPDSVWSNLDTDRVIDLAIYRLRGGARALYHDKVEKRTVASNDVGAVKDDWEPAGRPLRPLFVVDSACRLVPGALNWLDWSELIGNHLWSQSLFGATLAHNGGCDLPRTAAKPKSGSAAVRHVASKATQRCVNTGIVISALESTDAEMGGNQETQWRTLVRAALSLPSAGRICWQSLNHIPGGERWKHGAADLLSSMPTRVKFWFHHGDWDGLTRSVKRATSFKLLQHGGADVQKDKGRQQPPKTFVEFKFKLQNKTCFIKSRRVKSTELLSHRNNSPDVFFGSAQGGQFRYVCANPECIAFRSQINERPHFAVDVSLRAVALMQGFLPK